MRQALRYIAVWCGATTLAVSVAWFGVRDVLRSEVFDDAKIEPLSAAITRTGAAPLPSGAPSGPSGLPSTPAAPDKRGRAHRTATPEPARTTAEPEPARSPSKTTRTPAPPENSTGPVPSSTQVPEAGEDVRVVRVKGGSASFVIEGGACRLVTAAPNAGYETKVSQADGWIRVDLVQGGHGSAVFCIGGENRTDTWEY
ncbi:hypothetical protein [Streptosporangium sp. NPDC000396]|uniref:hypothetical protein n=1 Tax=Streptosporangium sp. NPDC000396 TaxID=3366185 RepID=UPI0036A835BE